MYTKHERGNTLISGHTVIIGTFIAFLYGYAFDSLAGQPAQHTENLIITGGSFLMLLAFFLYGRGNK